MSTLLLVVPHQGLRAAFRALLEDEGYQVVESLGAEVRALVIDVTIGEAVCAVTVAQVRSAREEFPVVFIVDGRRDDDIQSPPLEDPASRYVCMPLDVEALVSALRDLGVPPDADRRSPP